MNTIGWVIAAISGYVLTAVTVVFFIRRENRHVKLMDIATQRIEKLRAELLIEQDAHRNAVENYRCQSEKNGERCLHPRGHAGQHDSYMSTWFAEPPLPPLEEGFKFLPEPLRAACIAFVKQFERSNEGKTP